MSECHHTVTDSEGIEEPCNRPATGWRWYQDCPHEDTLEPACGFHANEGGVRMAALMAERDDALARLADVRALHRQSRVVLNESELAMAYRETQAALRAALPDEPEGEA